MYDDTDPVPTQLIPDSARMHADPGSSSCGIPEPIVIPAKLECKKAKWISRFRGNDGTS